MFEDSLMESGGQLKTKSKYWMIASGFFWLAVLATLILIPLLNPEALPKGMMLASLSAPPPTPPPPPPPPPPEAVQPVHMVSELDSGLHAPTKIPKDIKIMKDDAPPPAAGGVVGMGAAGGNGAPGGVFGGMGLNSGPTIAVAKPKPTGPARISGGVMQGQIITRTQPVYPPIAKAAHVSGTVVLHAIISKTGTIENLQVQSGPVMLRQAAIDAIQHWRYKPYLLNGEPTEVDTLITVNFTNGG